MPHWFKLVSQSLYIVLARTIKRTNFGEKKFNTAHDLYATRCSRPLLLIFLFEIPGLVSVPYVPFPHRIRKKIRGPTNHNNYIIKIWKAEQLKKEIRAVKSAQYNLYKKKSKHILSKNSYDFKYQPFFQIKLFLFYVSFFKYMIFWEWVRGEKT